MGEPTHLSRAWTDLWTPALGVCPHGHVGPQGVREALLQRTPQGQQLRIPLTLCRHAPEPLVVQFVEHAQGELEVVAVWVGAACAVVGGDAKAGGLQGGD